MLRSILKHTRGAALVVLLLIIVGLWTQEWIHRSYEAFDTVWLGSGREGLIMIDTPQLYTRDRLVNDRFREAAWLEQQLEETDDLLEQQRFGQADLLQARLHELKMAIGGDLASATASSAAPDSKRFPDPGELQPTPHDEIEDVLRYRETLRAQLMDTQLDDRHDIAGNTIYRFNFHAVIVPERGTRRPAAISVQLKETDARLGKTSSYVDLWYDWKDELQRQISSLVEDKVLSIIQGAGLSPFEHRALMRYINGILDENGIRDFASEIYGPVIDYRKRQFLEHVLGVSTASWKRPIDNLIMVYRPDRVSLWTGLSKDPVLIFMLLRASLAMMRNRIPHKARLV